MPWWGWILVLVLALLTVSTALALQLRRDPFASAILRQLQALGWKQRFRIARGLTRDSRVPRVARVLPVLLVLYLAMPIDVIPDFVPLLGQLDDLLVVAVLLWLFARLVPRTVLTEHVERETAAE